MLKRLAIVILLAVVLPVHGQEKGTQSGGNQSNGNGSQNVTAPPSGTATCVVKQEGTAIECKWPKDVPESKFRRLFSPENAPNVGLFFVGFGGVIAALFTLLAINKQAALMKEQLDTSRQKERARLRIELEGLDLSLTNSPDMILIGCKIRNYGGSGAFTLMSLYACWIGQSATPEGPPHLGVPMVLPQVLLPGDKPCDPAMFVPDENRVVDWTLWGSDDPRIESLRKGETSLYLSGFIHYQNIFDETWSLGFKRKFTAQVYAEGLSMGHWSQEGGDAENYERMEITSSGKLKAEIGRKRWIRAFSKRQNPT